MHRAHVYIAALIILTTICPSTGARRRQHIGTLGPHTVYIGELIGVVLALELALDETHHHPGLPVRIFTDNQATIMQSRTLPIRPIRTQKYFLKKYDNSAHPSLSTGSQALRGLPAMSGRMQKQTLLPAQSWAEELGPGQTQSEFSTLISGLYMTTRNEAMSKWSNGRANGTYG